MKATPSCSLFWSMTVVEDSAVIDEVEALPDGSQPVREEGEEGEGIWGSTQPEYVDDVSDDHTVIDKTVVLPDESHNDRGKGEEGKRHGGAPNLS